MGRVGALLALWCVSLAAEPGYRVQVAEPELWQPLLATVGFEATAEAAPLRSGVGKIAHVECFCCHKASLLRDMPA